MSADPEFENLVQLYYRDLYRFGLSLTGSEADACDLTQETFYIWANKRHQLKNPAKVKAWLFTTLHRIFLEAPRRQTRFPHRGLEEFAPEDLPASSPPSDDHLDSRAPDLAALFSRFPVIFCESERGEGGPKPVRFFGRCFSMAGYGHYS